MSGKFGYATGSSMMFASSGVLVDYDPPYIANYMTTLKNSPAWSSIVFHCASTDARLLCGKLSTTDISACTAAYRQFSAASTPPPSLSPATVLVSPLPTAGPTVSTTAQYCGTFRAEEAGDASGYFAMKISNGEAKYSFDVDLTSFALTSACPTLLTSGLKYHIHSYWKNTTVSSSAGSKYCGSSFTGGHYDPNYACSASSQGASSGCVNLNRTSSRGYSYTCNTTINSAGEYSEW